MYIHFQAQFYGIFWSTYNFVEVLCLCAEGEALSFLVEVASFIVLQEEFTVTLLSVHPLHFDLGTRDSLLQGEWPGD